MSATDIQGGEETPPLVRPKLDRRLVEGRIASTLVRFAAPLLFTNFMLAVSATWGAIWVSHLLGPNALTAVANATLFVNLMIGVILGVGSTAGIAVAQAIGAHDLAGAKRVVANALLFALGASVVIAAAGIAFAPQVLTLIRMPPEAWDPAVVYLRTTCLSLPSTFLLIFCFMLVRGTGDARTPFIFTLVAIAIGLVATPAFLIGVPSLGIAGAALSGVVANTISFALLVRHVYRRGLVLALHRADLASARPDAALVWMLVRRGAPVALEHVIVNGAYFVLLTMVNVHGAATAAAYAAAAQLWGYVQMPAIAIATSMSAMAAMNIGAGRWDRIDTIALHGSLVACGFTSAAAALCYALGDLPLRLFLPLGSASLVIAHELNLIVLWGWVVLAVTLGLNAMVRANGAMLAPTLIFAVTMWALRVPFAVALGPALGADAIWWSFPVGTVSSALLAYGYYRWGGWRARGLLLDEARGPASRPS